jgi:hypothetical protein
MINLLSAKSMFKHIIDLWLCYSSVSITIFSFIAIFNIQFYTIENIAFLFIPLIFAMIIPVWKLYKRTCVEKSKFILFKNTVRQTE